MTNTSDHSGHVHMAHLDLMPVDANGQASLATHVAINNGNWFSPTTWANGQVPGEGALVHVPAGITVTYEGASDAKLFMVRVDGALKMYAENGVATKMVVDTMVTSDHSLLEINARDASDGTVDIVFAEGTPAAHHGHFSDVSGGNGVTGRYNWDPDQLSLGLVASGTVDIKGQDVEAGAQLLVGPPAGAVQLVFAQPLEDPGWAIGQTIVIGGTKFLGRDANEQLITQDEVRTITGIAEVDGKMIVTIDAPLAYDHRGPADPTTGQELTGYVGNLSRNVTLSSEVADRDNDGLVDRGTSLGESLGADDHYVTQRGHVMFMHNDDVSVVDTGFIGLGRTDKSTSVDDIQTWGDQHQRMLADNGVPGQFDPETDTFLETADAQMTNPRGRYAIHLHEANLAGDHDHNHDEAHCADGVIGPCPETGDPICYCDSANRDQDGDGVVNAEDGDYFQGAYLEGNVVWGTPGWGIVQHSSSAVLQGNVVYDAAGSAYVAELGDETGRWQDNLAIGTYGLREKSDNADDNNFNEDEGDEGVGFYMKARALDVIDNVAVSSARAGFYYHNMGGAMREVDASADGVPAGIAQGLDTIAVEDVPITVFEGNEVIASRQGIRILTDPSDSVRKFNDAWSHMKDFTAWEIDEAGVSITYSSKYIFEDFLLLGTADKITADANQSSSGFFFKASVADITVKNSHVESFQHAVTNWVQMGDRQEYRRGYWDPKAPSQLGLAPEYEGMGEVEGITNAAHNLWNTNVVGLTYDDIAGVAFRSPSIAVETSPGVTENQRGIEVLASETQAGTPGVDIELLGDSRDGALVALWREDIANHANQEAMLATHIPLAYQDTVHLAQVRLASGQLIQRNTYLEYREGINDDIWSGTVLEFAKEDSLGRQVFLYGDFAPLDPSTTERAVTSNERIIFSKEVIDAVLVEEGFYTVAGVSDVRFVVLAQTFTDRLSGQMEVKKFLVALDIAWELPEGVRDAGLLHVSESLIVAPEYRVFENGVLVEGRAPIVLGADRAPNGEQAQVGMVTTDGADDLRLGADSDTVAAGGGDDIVRGLNAADWIDGGAGHDALFGGNGWDRLMGGADDDLLDGHLQRDFLYGGTGQDRLQGGVGRDFLDGGDGHDDMLGGSGQDELYGGAGDDIMDGGNGGDTMMGGTGHDRMQGGLGFDTLHGDEGDDVLSGNQGNDVLYGGEGGDALNGGARADQLFGGTGADILMGDSGADRLWGEDGVDILQGQLGTDQLYGGSDDDVLSGGAGSDRLFGGDGADRLHGDQGNDRLTGGTGADKFVFEQNSGNDVITDFEDGVDAIEFMIESFGFDDLSIVQNGADTVVTHHQGATLRLVQTDAAQIDASDFAFLSPE